MSSASESLFHGLLRSNQQMRTGFHASAEYNRLPCFLIFWNQFRISRAKGSSAAFPVHEVFASLSIHYMFLDFRYVVCDIVDEIHVHVLYFLVKDIPERFPYPMCYDLPVSEGHVRSA